MSNTLTSATSFNLNDTPYSGTAYNATLTGSLQSAYAQSSGYIYGSGDTLVASSSAAGSSLYGGSHQDSLVALGAGNWLIQNSTGNNTLVGDGTTTFSVGQASLLGANTILGGVGIETLQIAVSDTLSDSLLSSVSSVEALQLTGTSKATLAGNAQNAGIATVYGGNGATTIDASAYTTGVTLNATANTLTGDLLIGSTTANSDFIVNGTSNFRKNKIYGGEGTDTIQVATSLTTVDQFRNVHDVEVLSLGGASNVQLGTNAAVAGIEKVVGSAASVTLVQTASNGQALSLIGSSANDSIVVSSYQDLVNDTIYGGGGTDTLQVASPTYLRDTGFVNVHNIKAVQLNSPSTIRIGANAAAAGLQTVFGGAGSDTFQQFYNNGPLSLIGGGAGDMFLIGYSTLLPNDSIYGGAGVNTLAMNNASQSLGGNEFAQVTGVQVLSLAGGTNVVDLTAAGGSQFQSVFGGKGRDFITESSLGAYINGGVGQDTVAITGAVNTEDSLLSLNSIEVLSLAGGGSLQIGSNAAAAGIKTIVGAASSVTLAQTSSNTEALSLVGSSANDSISVSSLQTLINDTIDGAGGNDTLQINSQAYVRDTSLANVRGIEAIQLTSPSTIRLGSGASLAGVQSVFGGEGSDTFQQFSNSSALTLSGGDGGDLYLIANSTLLGADSIIGGTASGYNSAIDTLALNSGSQSLVGSVFTKVSNVEVLSLAGGNNVVDLTASGGSQFSTVIGGSGNDSFTIGNLGTVDIVGGAGTDTVALTNGANISDNDFRSLTSVEVLQTGAGVRTNLELGAQANDTGISSVIAGAGSSLDAAVTNGYNNPVYIDGTQSGYVDVLFTNSNLDYVPTISGSAAGTNDYVDFEWGATVGDDAFYNIHNIEGLRLNYQGAAASNVELGTFAEQTGINYVSGGQGSITLTQNFGDSNASTFVGGAAGGNLFRIEDSTLLGNDVIAGSGNDTLSIITDADQTLASFSNVSGVEVLKTGNGNNVVNLTGGEGAPFASVIGGSGNDSFLVGTVGTVDIQGGAGTDTVVVENTYSGISDAQFAALSSIEVLETTNTWVGLGKEARDAGISSLISGGGWSEVAVGSDFTTPLYHDGSKDYYNLTAFNNDIQFADSTLIGSTLPDSYGGDVAFVAGDANINDDAFASKSKLDALLLTGDVDLSRWSTQSGKYTGITPTTSSVFLGQNAQEAGVSLVGTTSGKYNTQTPGQVSITQSAYDTNHTSIYGGAGNDTFTIATESQLANDTIHGASPWTNSSKYTNTVQTRTETNTLVFGRTDLPVIYTNAATDIGFEIGGSVNQEQYTEVQSLDNPVAVYNTLGDEAFANVSGIQVLSLQGTNSGVYIGDFAAAAGIQTVIGSASGSSIYQDQILLPNCGTPTGLDVIGQNGNDLIALADAGFLAYDRIDGGKGVNTLGAYVYGGYVPNDAVTPNGIRNYSSLGDQSFVNVENIQNLSIYSEGTQVLLGANAFHAGIDTVSVTTGDAVSTTWNSIGVGRNLTLDASNSDGFNVLAGQLPPYLQPADTLIAPLYTTEFIFSTEQALGTSSVIGNDYNNSYFGGFYSTPDTLYMNSDSCEGVVLNDTTFAGVHAVTALALNGNVVANLGSLASGTNSSKYRGIETVYGGVDYNSLGDTFGDTIVQTSSWSTLHHLTIIGGQGNDSISIANTTLLGNDSIYGGAGNDTLSIDGGVTLNDSFTSLGGSVTGIEALQLTCSTGGEGVGSAITLGSVLANEGLSSIYGSDCADTIVQQSTDTLHSYIAAGDGNDTIAVGTVSILGNDTISGGGGIDTLQIDSNGNYEDSLFANVSSIEVLTTSTTNSSYTNVTLGSAALNAGISSLIAGFNSRYGLNLTQTAEFSDTLYIDGSASGSYNSFTFANGSQFASDTLIGSTLAASNGFGNSVIFEDTVSLTDAAFANKSGFGYNEGEIHLKSGDQTAGSSVTLGSNAQTMNFSEVYGGFGSDTLIQTAQDTLGIEFYTNSSYTSNGYFAVANDTLLANDTFSGNDYGSGYGIDTLAIGSSTNSSAYSYADTVFGNIYSADVLELSNSSNYTGVTLAGTAQGAGISTVVAAGSWYGNVDASGYTNDIYIDGTNSSYTMTLTGGSGNDTILGGYWNTNVLTGGEGNDLISVELGSNYSVDGGGGIDTLQIRNANNDYITYSDWSSITNMEALSLEGGDITLNASASLAGFTDVYFTGSLGGRAYQAADDSLSINFHGSDGGDLFVFENTTLLGNDAVTGKGGIDTIGFTSAVTLTDATFANVSGIDVLTIAGGSYLNLPQGGAAQASGISSIYGGSSTLGDTIALAFTSQVDVYIEGSAGSDVINISGGGNDTIKGWNGASSLNSHNDSLTNGANPDVVVLGDTVSNAYGNGTGAVAYVNAYKAGQDKVVLHNFGNGAADYSLTTLAGPYNAQLKHGDSLVAKLSIGSTNNFFNNVDFQYSQSSLDSAASITGGNGNDLFVIPNNSLLGSDTINGLAGTDTVTVSHGYDYSDTAFANVSSIEWLTVENLNGSLPATGVELGAAAAKAGISSIASATFSSYTLNVTQTAEDTLSTYFNGTGSGTYGNSFTVANDTLLGNDTLIGSATADDTLNLGGSPNAAFYEDSVFANVSSFEVLTTGTSSSYNVVTLGTSAQAAGIASVIGGVATGNGIYVLGSDTVTSYFDLSASTGQAGVSFSNGSQFGSSTLIGSTLAALNSGSSYNWAAISTAATLSDEAFANKSDLNALYLNDANNLSSAVTLGANAAEAGINYVQGGYGDGTYGDTISHGNATATSIFGGSSNDLVNIIGDEQPNLDTLLNDTLNGRDGIDTLNVGGAATLADAAFTKVSNFENLSLSGGEVTLGSNATLAGFTLASASSSTLAESFNVAGSGLDVIGSSLGDSFTMADNTLLGSTTINGGAGIDTLNLPGGYAYADSIFGGVSNVEVLNFLNATGGASGTTSATLGTEATRAGFTTVYGSTNTSNNIDASADTLSQLIVGAGYRDTLATGTGNDTLQAWIGNSTSNRNDDTMSGGSGSDLFILGDTLGNAYGDGTGAIAYINDFNQGTDYLDLHNFGSNGATGATAYSYAEINDGRYNFEIIHAGTVVAKLDVQNLNACCFLADSNVKYLGTPSCGLL